MIYNTLNAIRAKGGIKLAKRSTKKGHRDGANIIGRHTTVTEASEKVLDRLERKFDGITYKPGRIDNLSRKGRRRSGGRFFLKIIEREGGLLLKVQGSGGIQEIYLRLDEVLRQEVAQWLLFWYEPACSWCSLRDQAISQLAAKYGLSAG